MANNYTLFSEKIEGLTPAAAEWVGMVLALEYDEPEDLEKLKEELSLESDDPRFFEELDGWPYFEAEVQPSKYAEDDECPMCKQGTLGLESDRLVCRGECGQFVDTLSSLWLYSEEGLMDDHLIWFIQALILKFLPSDYVFTATFACTCSRPRIGEFGGYWIAISKDDVEFGNTWDALEGAAERLQKKE